MMKKEERVRIFIPYIWSLFKRYLNNTGYYVRAEDRLSTLFMKGESDVKEMIDELNKKSIEENTGITFKYKKRITYSKLLLQI